jgi:EAL domain-containing protein (putative c-di-GMP-specific phosphodiesterase class I)
VLPGTKKLIAAATGIVLAGIPVLAVDYLLDQYIERQSQQEVELTARRGIWLAESRIRRTITALTELGRAGVQSCAAGDLQALNATLFNITPVKELSVVGPGGDTLCTNFGQRVGGREILSSEVFAFAANIFLDVVRMPGQPELFVRIRRMDPDGANGLAALIPSELFLPQVSNTGGPLRVHTLIVTRGGTSIGERGASPVKGQAQSDRIVVSAPSEHYGLHLTASMSRQSLAASFRDVRSFGLTASGGFAIALLILAMLAFWRGRDDPIVELRRALDRGELIPYYQPILDITNGRLEGAEVLLRWRKADGSITPPGGFVPLLESSGLIFDVTRALMQRVCREAGAAIGNRPGFKISFNLTALHFSQDATISDVREIFAGSPIALTQLVLEVTEREPLTNLAAARRVIAGLQELGVRIAIDDVGAGHGGLSYLLKLGVDIIKIDKLFVDAIGAERHSAAIIDSLVELARSMRIDIVAEGVENFEQVAYLRDHGIRLAQGYVFAPPLPGSSFLQLIEAIDPPGGGVAEGAGTPAIAHLVATRNQLASV